MLLDKHSKLIKKRKIWRKNCRGKGSLPLVDCVRFVIKFPYFERQTLRK